MIKFENPENGRWYYILIQKDLVSENAVTVVRGGRDRVVVRHAGFYSRADLDIYLAMVQKRRIRNGYRLVQ